MLAQRIETYWDKRADTYSAFIKEELACSKKQAWELLLRKYAGNESGQRVLDVGTGPGFFAILLAGMGYAVTAADPCSEMLKQARSHTDRAGVTVQFVQGEAHKLELPAASLDLIVSRNVTWLLPEPLSVFREWSRLLKPGGKALIFDANWYHYLTSEEARRNQEQRLRQAAERGYVSPISQEQKEESEAIARLLPLTWANRPGWDREALLQCGFQRVEVEENINLLVLDAMQQFLYERTPMFAICAHK